MRSFLSLFLDNICVLNRKVDVFELYCANNQHSDEKVPEIKEK